MKKTYLSPVTTSVSLISSGVCQVFSAQGEYSPDYGGEDPGEDPL